MALRAKVKVGYHFGLEIPYEAEKERFEAVAFVAKYIDENIDKITAAAKGPVDDLWSESLKQSKEAYEAQKEKADVQQLSPTAMDQARDRLREMIKKTIKKKLMEQTGFETRLFQVNLRLSIDKGQGGGIEQKLNRIRAINGVTVVSHEEGGSIGGKETIEARVKFHPTSDSIRPFSYVSQTLVPEINSSKLVPGVKVIDIVKGSLKRLDK
jgi:hypothetical protein